MRSTRAARLLPAAAMVFNRIRLMVVKAVSVAEKKPEKATSKIKTAMYTQLELSTKDTTLLFCRPLSMPSSGSRAVSSRPCFMIIRSPP